MKFKSDIIKQELIVSPQLLQIMAEDMDMFCQGRFGQEIIITRVKEHIDGDSGVHEQGRAFDVRNEFDGGFLYTDDQKKQIVDYMNKKYPRLDGKVTCLSHSFDGGPVHFHVQMAYDENVYLPSRIGA